MRVGLQLYSRDLGNVGNNKLDLDWAYGDYRLSDEIGFRAGRFKQPYGLYGETRDLDVTRTSALLPNSIYSPILRDFDVAMNGAQVYGRIEIGPLGALSYQASIGNTNYDKEDGGVAYYFRVQGAMTQIDTLGSKAIYNGALWWEPPIEGLRIGATASQTQKIEATGKSYYADPTTGARTYYDQNVDVPYYTTYVLSAELARGDWLVAAEWKFNYLDAAYQITDKGFINAQGQAAYDGYYNYLTTVLGLPPAVAAAQASATQAALVNQLSDHPRIPRGRTHGGYCMAQYRLNPKVEIGAYANFYFGDIDNDMKSFQRDYALSLRYDVLDNWLMKIEGHFIDGSGQVDQDKNTSPKRVWHMVVARTSYSF